MTKIPLILVPGLLCDTELWRHQIDTLGDLADIRVADVGQDESIAGMARRLLADAPDSFALAGLSMGGYVAFEVLRQVPERVTRLALIDTTAAPDTPERSEERRALIDASREGAFRGVTRRLLPKLLHPARLDDDGLTRIIYEMAERTGRDGFVRQQRAIIGRPDSRHDLGLIHCPTLVVCGRQDVLTPLAQAREMAEGLRDAALVIIEDSGHLPPLEQPIAVSALMRYWLHG